MTRTRQTAIADFRRLHDEGCFVLPNPWDVGTAIYLEHLGFKALATTSAGYAFSRGKPDGAVSRDDMLIHIGEVVAATPLPVNADFLNGFADEPEEVAANVTRCIATGVAGLSIEDSTGRNEPPLYEENLAVDRIRAARKAIDVSQSQVLLTGRCEAFLVRHDGTARTCAGPSCCEYARGGAGVSMRLVLPNRKRLLKSLGQSLRSRLMFSSPGSIRTSRWRNWPSSASAASRSGRASRSRRGAPSPGPRGSATEGRFKDLWRLRTTDLNDLFGPAQKRITAKRNMFCSRCSVLTTSHGRR